MCSFFRRYGGSIVIFLVLVFACFAPVIFTSPGFECFNKTATGQIGDTLGGTTAPVFGFLSIILLYATLREQQKFNAGQQSSNDYGMFISLRGMISDMSRNVEIIVFSNEVNRLMAYQGFSHVFELRRMSHPTSVIDHENLKLVYDRAGEVSELCILYYNQLVNSPLDVKVKQAFFRSVAAYSEHLCQLFNLCKNDDLVNVSDSDNGADIYKPVSEDYLRRFSAVYRELSKVGVRSE